MVEIDISNCIFLPAWFPKNRFLQILLLLAALVAVPWMLFPKPFILRKRHAEVPPIWHIQAYKLDT